MRREGWRERGEVDDGCVRCDARREDERCDDLDGRDGAELGKGRIVK